MLYPVDMLVLLDCSRYDLLALLDDQDACASLLTISAALHQLVEEGLSGTLRSFTRYGCSLWLCVKKPNRLVDAWPRRKAARS